MESWSFKKNRGGELLERNYYPPVDILVSLRKKKRKKKKRKKEKRKKKMEISHNEEGNEAAR